MCVPFYCSFVCTSVYAYDSKSIEGVRAITLEFCGSTHHCAPLVCVPDVRGGLLVWWHNQQNPNQELDSYSRKLRHVNSSSELTD